MRRASVIAFVLAALLLLAGCWREFLRNAPADAKKGATFGFAVDGPLGAAIGSVASLAFCAVMREVEKRQLRRSGVLTDKRARQEAITARTERPASPPQSLFPTDSTLGD